MSVFTILRKAAAGAAIVMALGLGSEAKAQSFGWSHRSGNHTYHHGTINGQPFFGSSHSAGSTTFHNGTLGSQPFFGSSTSAGSSTFHHGMIGGQPYSGTTYGPRHHSSSWGWFG